MSKPLLDHVIVKAGWLTIAHTQNPIGLIKAYRGASSGNVRFRVTITGNDPMWFKLEVKDVPAHKVP